MAATDTHPRSINALLDAPPPGTATWRPAVRYPAPGEGPSAEPPAASHTADAPEPYLSKQATAAHYSMSVRWLEQRIRDGLPVADFMDGRPRLRLSETDTWLRAHGHLTGERPESPRPGTKAGA